MPFVSTIANHIKRIATPIGVKVTIWQNQGQPSQWVQGMNAAIAQRANAIVLLAGNDPAGLQPQIRAAKAKGIPTIVAHLYDQNQPSAPNVGGRRQHPVQDRRPADRRPGDRRHEGRANALVVTINQVKSTVPMVAGIREEFRKYCQGCKLTYTDVTIAEFATKIQPNVQAALTADPGMNYVIALYDSAEVPFVAAAIRAAGRTGRVKVSTFNGTPEILKMVTQGDIVSADVGENLEWIGYAVVDQSMRVMGGLKPVKNARVPVRVFDKSNIAQAGPKFTPAVARHTSPATGRSGACRVAAWHATARAATPRLGAPRGLSKSFGGTRAPSRRRPERAPRGGPRPPRGERLRQVDADQGPRGLPRARRRRAADRRRGGAPAAPARAVPRARA